MKDKTISVVVATYNGGKFIEQQIQSIIEQTFVPTEIIITDGGSTDNTLFVAEQLLKTSGINYKILKSKKQLSVRDNFQKGLEHADSQYIFFCDQDDFWLKEKIEMTIFFIEKYHAVLAFTNAKLVDEELVEYKECNLWKKIKYNVNSTVFYTKGDTRFIQELVRHNVVTGMCLCITRDLKPKVLPFSENGIHDSWIAINAIYYGSVIAIDKKLVLYRQHKTNAIGASDHSLRERLKKATKYTTNIGKRLKFIKEWKIKNNIDYEFVNKYIEYLQFRMDYLNKNNNALGLLVIFTQYFNYEVRPLSTIVKDFYYRIFIK